MNDDLKGCGILAAAGIGGVALVCVLGLATNWFGLVTQRPMAKYAEQTRKEVYDTSRQFQQGTNRDIARYCEKMRGADTTAARRAVAALIRSTASTYDGELSPDNTDCITEARGK